MFWNTARLGSKLAENQINRKHEMFWNIKTIFKEEKTQN